MQNRRIRFKQRRKSIEAMDDDDFDTITTFSSTKIDSISSSFAPSTDSIAASFFSSKKVANEVIAMMKALDNIAKAIKPKSANMAISINDM